VVVGGFGPWRDAIDKVAALKPRDIEPIFATGFAIQVTPLGRCTREAP
jgi:hypothetical protein